MLIFAGVAAVGGFVVGAAFTSEIFRLVMLVAVVAAGSWFVRGLIARSQREPAPLVERVRRSDTFWPARCSHCGVRGGPRTRMIAGRDAYICELCLRRGVELLDSPDDITRFM